MRNLRPHTAQRRTRGQNGLPFVALAEIAGNPSAAVLAQQLGVTRRTVHRWRRTGVIPAHQVDRAAVALGHHPAEIWPTEWNEA